MHEPEQSGEPISSKAAFFDREAELGELRLFTQSSEHVVLVIRGKPGMGKSALVRQFCQVCDNDQSVWFTHLFNIPADQSPESLSGELNEALARGQFLLWGPDSRRQLLTLAKAIPTLGPLFDALFGERHTNERGKLLQLLELLASKTDKRIVLVTDPYDCLLRTEHVEFFSTLAQKLPVNVKMIVPQRETDLLARSTHFLSLKRVTTSTFLLGPLPEDAASAQAKSLLPKSLSSDETVRSLWKQFEGWPLGVYLGARALQTSPKPALPQHAPRDLSAVCADLLSSCPDGSRTIIYTLALAPLAFHSDDLPAVSGLSGEQFASAVDSAPVIQATASEDKFGTSHVRLFHSLFRDHVRRYMASHHVSERPYLVRLYERLSSEALLLDKESDALTISKRDARALSMSRKLLLYQGILEPSEELRNLAECLFSRVASLRLGGRSYSLYSLLVLANARALTVSTGKVEWALRILNGVLLEDSFIHPEYAAILMGSLLVRSAEDVDDELYQVCTKRLNTLTDRQEAPLLKKAAARVLYAVTGKQDPLSIFSLDALLPSVYQDESLPSLSTEEFAELEARAKPLTQTPTHQWTPEDHDIMYEYIRILEAKG